jgi:hypothetical protein
MIEKITNLFKKGYTEKETKMIANDAYLQGAIDFHNSKMDFLNRTPAFRWGEQGNSFNRYWDNTKINGFINVKK